MICLLHIWPQQHAEYLDDDDLQAMICSTYNLLSSVAHSLYNPTDLYELTRPQTIEEPEAIADDELWQWVKLNEHNHNYVNALIGKMLIEWVRRFGEMHPLAPKAVSVAPYRIGLPLISLDNINLWEIEESLPGALKITPSRQNYKENRERKVYIETEPPKWLWKD